MVQLYEHSRGGHIDPTITIADYNGNLYFTLEQYSGEFAKAAFDNKKIWLLHRNLKNYKDINLLNFTGTSVIQLDLKTGRIDREMPIKIPKNFIDPGYLSHGWLTSIGLPAMQVTFEQIDEQVVLNIDVISFQKNKNRPYEPAQIPLNKFLRE